MSLKKSYAERVRELMDRGTWGDGALPPLTMTQARLLLGALADMHAVGMLQGQLMERDAIRRWVQRECPLILSFGRRVRASLKPGTVH